MTGWLYGWKEIGEYIGCGSKTAQNYFKKFHLPIDRLPNNKPIAYPLKIDDWIKKVKISQKPT